MTTIQTGKLAALLQSRKFYTLLSSLATIFFAAYFHAIPVDQAVQLAIAAFAVYMGATALEDSGKATPPNVIINHTSPTPPTVTMTSGGHVNATTSPGIIVGGNPPHVT